MGNLRSFPKVRIFWKKLATQVNYGNSGRVDRARPAEAKERACEIASSVLLYHLN